MMHAFFFLLLLAGSVFLGLYLSEDPGYVLISTQHWSIETTVWVGLLLLLFSFALFHLLCVWGRLLIELPRRIREGYRHHKQHQAQIKTQQGLIEFSEGHWRAAETHLIKALPYASLPLFNYLTAACAAQEQGSLLLRDQYLREAQHKNPKARVAIRLTQAQLQIKSQQWEQALATLQALHEQAPKQPYVLLLLAQLYETLKDWPALLRLMPALKKHARLPKAQFEIMQRRLSLASFLDLFKHAGQEQTVGAAFKALPKPYQQDPAFLAPYCHYLCDHQDWQQANILLKQALNKELQDDLLCLYADIPTEENKLECIKTLLKKHPDSAGLHFCLGRLYLETRLFGQARLHLEQSLAMQPHPRVYFYLGQTLEELGLRQEACAVFKRGCSERR